MYCYHGGLYCSALSYAEEQLALISAGLSVADKCYACHFLLGVLCVCAFSATKKNSFCGSVVDALVLLWYAAASRVRFW